MAGRKQRPGSVGVTREQYQEQQARQIPSAYGEGYGGKLDLHPQRYPNAISHDTAFHDHMFEHIANLRSRIDGAMQSGDVKKAAGKVYKHLDSASNELNRSFAAHKAGSDGGVVAFHTANEAYVRANQHLSNAHRELVNTLGLKSSGLRKIGGENPDLPLLTSTQREGLTKDYSNHIRTVAQNKKMALPEGVAADRKVDLADMGEVQPINRNTAKYTRVPSVTRPAVGSGRSLTEKAMEGGRAPTLGQVRSADLAAKEGVKLPKSKPSAYSGVGITGFSTVANAAKIHFEFHNPGRRWSESLESKDPVGYAVKHKVGLPSQEATMSKTLRMMKLDNGLQGGNKRESVADTTVGQIARGKYSEEPEVKTTSTSRSENFTQGGNK